MRPRLIVTRTLLCLCTLVYLNTNQFISAQIGGKTAADGVAVLDDVEDLDLNAGGVGRDWIPDFVPGSSNAFTTVSLGSPGLTLAPDQSTTGALRYAMKSYYGYVNYSFGVPMPSVKGAYTTTHPGNLTSFTHMTFLISSSTVLNDQVQEVILETYPGPNYPSIRWDYNITAGAAFQTITIDLRQPTYILNQNGLPIEELLGKTRYLAFYFYGGPHQSLVNYTVHIDDIRFTGFSHVPDWSVY